MSAPLREEICDWLRCPVDLAVVEQHRSECDLKVDTSDPDWLALIAQLGPARLLWYFRSPDETWTGFPLRGMEGYAVVDGEAVVDIYLTAIS
jgi:hypothetical protein